MEIKIETELEDITNEQVVQALSIFTPYYKALYEVLLIRYLPNFGRMLAETTGASDTRTAQALAIAERAELILYDGLPLRCPLLTDKGKELLEEMSNR